MSCSFFIVLFPEDCYVSVSVCVCAHFCSFSFCSVVFRSFFYAQFSAIFVQFQFFEFIFVQFQFVQLSVSFSVIFLCLVFSFLYLHFLVLVLFRLQVLNQPKKWWLWRCYYVSVPVVRLIPQARPRFCFASLFDNLASSRPVTLALGWSMSMARTRSSRLGGFFSVLLDQPYFSAMIRVYQVRSVQQGGLCLP